MNNESNAAPIVIDNLHKKFGEQTVLNGISLQVERGETVAVLGRSGIGRVCS
jgi:polar amino acid transport system ATP-binding protein